MDGKMSLEITLGNATMQTPDDLAYALGKVAREIQLGWVSSIIQDRNGNTVGNYLVEFEN